VYFWKSSADEQVYISCKNPNGVGKGSKSALQFETAWTLHNHQLLSIAIIPTIFVHRIVCLHRHPMPVERSIKDRGKKVTERFLSISRSSSPNPQSANISTNTRLQASNDLTLIRQADRASGIATPTVPDPSKQSQPAKPDQTSLTQTDEQQQLAEATVRVWSLQNWHEIDHHLQPVMVCWACPGCAFCIRTS
jgi:hypothetical protein